MFSAPGLDGGFTFNRELVPFGFVLPGERVDVPPGGIGPPAPGPVELAVFVEEGDDRFVGAEHRLSVFLEDHRFSIEGFATVGGVEFIAFHGFSFHVRVWSRWRWIDKS